MFTLLSEFYLNILTFIFCNKHIDLKIGHSRTRTASDSEKDASIRKTGLLYPKMLGLTNIIPAN